MPMRSGASPMPELSKLALLREREDHIEFKEAKHNYPFAGETGPPLEIGILIKRGGDSLKCDSMVFAVGW